jgi:hypothetical protein
MDFGVVGGLIAARIDVFLQSLCAMLQMIPPPLPLSWDTDLQINLHLQE